MIRRAVRTDRLDAIRLLRESHAGAGFDRPDGPSGFYFPFLPNYAERLFLSHIASRHYALVHDVGGSAQGLLLASAYEHPFGPVWMARETVWWIDPAHRGTAAVRMLDAYEAWAAEQGCRFIGMAGMGDDPAVGRLYERRGYRRAETNFLKAI